MKNLMKFLSVSTVLAIAGLSSVTISNFLQVKVTILFFRFFFLTYSVFHRMFDKFTTDVLILEVEQVGKILGRGAFGHVVKLKCKGYDQPLAGKILKDEDLGSTDEEADRAVDTFCREYKCLSTLKHHRNIVQYEGICFTVNSDFPVLVMQLMPTDLHKYLQHKSNAKLPLERKIAILHEVARGLVCLHRNKIIHRDLTAKNVLLDAHGTPKISDFGNSRLIDNVTATSYLGAMTDHVGTRCYMAPEVEMESAHYNHKVDVFSFGHLALFVSTQIFPRSLKPVTYKSADRVHARSEVERREEYFQMLSTDFPLTLLIKNCLDVDLESRPNSAVVKQELSRLSLRMGISTAGV